MDKMENESYTFTRHEIQSSHFALKVWVGGEDICHWHV